MARMKSAMASSCAERLVSMRSSIVAKSRAISALADARSRRRTNVRMISMFTAIALADFSIEESIATPCSVKHSGGYRLPPRRFPFRISELEHEIRWKALGIPANGLHERLRRHAVKRRDFAVRDDPLIPHVGD
jgi:hypothetical protein